MTRKLLLVSVLLFSAGAIFFLTLFSEIEVFGQTNTESPCCTCASSTGNLTIPDGSYSYDTNRERLSNRQIDNSGNSMLVIANTNTSNQNSCCQYQKKTISLPEVNFRIAPFLKAVLEHQDSGNYMEFAEYFGINIGTKNYYFREDNESIKNIGSKEADTKKPEICGRYVLVYSFLINKDLNITADGAAVIWRNFGGKWKPVMDVGDWTYQEIYPLIMTKAEMNCLKAIEQ